MAFFCFGVFIYRVEVFDVGGFKGFRYSLGCGYVGYRVVIVNGFVYGDNVGDKVFFLQLEGLEVFVYSVKVYLNFICDKDFFGFADVFVVEDRSLMGIVVGGLDQEWEVLGF